MKVSNTVSTLACLALLSTYSVNGFAKTGNGDSYSGPTLSGSAVALTLDKPVLNTQLTKAIKSCMVEGGNESYLAKILSSFYGKGLKYVEETYVNDEKRNKNGTRANLRANDYFNKDIQDNFASDKHITDYDSNDLTAKFEFSGQSRTVTSKGWRKVTVEVRSELNVLVHLSKDGVLKLSTRAETYYDGSSLNNETRNEAYKVSQELKGFYKERFLIVENLPVFSAKVQSIDIFDQINGDFLRQDRMLKDLKMIYDRNEKAPYSQILNASHEYKVAPTQFMAPNAEFADCVSDKLGRL